MGYGVISSTLLLMLAILNVMKKLILTLSVPLLITIIFGTIYAVAQQSLRQGANDPQIQLAEDAAAQLDGGVQPQHLVSGSVDIASSLAPFIVIYDNDGKAIAATGQLNSELPSVPQGILTAAANRAYHTVTWQPEAGVRVAAVTVKAKNYYVLSGRSLKEVEKRADRLLFLTALGWFMAIAGFVVTYAVAYTRIRRL